MLFLGMWWLHPDLLPAQDAGKSFRSTPLTNTSSGLETHVQMSGPSSQASQSPEHGSSLACLSMLNINCALVVLSLLGTVIILCRQFYCQNSIVIPGACASGICSGPICPFLHSISSNHLIGTTHLKLCLLESQTIVRLFLWCQPTPSERKIPILEINPQNHSSIYHNQ